MGFANGLIFPFFPVFAVLLRRLRRLRDWGFLIKQIRLPYTEIWSHAGMITTVVTLSREAYDQSLV